MKVYPPGGRPAKKPTWIMLVHEIPPKPSYLRVKVRRELRKLGAVAIKNSVYVAPAGPAIRDGLNQIIQGIRRAGGSGAVCEARFIDGLSDDAVVERFQAERDAEYRTIADEAERVQSRLGRAGARRAAGAKLQRLRLRFRGVVAMDRFGAAERERAAGLLSLLEDRVQGIDRPGGGLTPPKPARGSLWVTRKGVGVDRIASAWLIRRFIDREARFKFVSSRGYRPARAELRFDMAGGQFTHQEGHCTFETLREHFRLRDHALRPIAEIVHDLDLNDDRYRRPEAAGLDRMIVGITLTTSEDAERLKRGGVVFEDLYRYFRNHGSRPSVGTPPLHGKRARAPSRVRTSNTGRKS